MKDFTPFNLKGLSSYGNLMKGLLLSMAMVLFQFTQVQAQEPAQAEQEVESFLYSPSIFMDDATGDPESAGFKLSDFSINARNMTMPLPNPDLSTGVDCGNLRVTFVLDESGSILTPQNAVEQVRESTLALAQVFLGTDARLSVIAFGSQAQLINLGGGAPIPSNGYVVDETFLDNLETYLYEGDSLGQFYDPQNPTPKPPCFSMYTNWEDALLLSAPLNPNLVLFLTDGDPNAYNNPNDNCGFSLNNAIALEAAIVAANSLKTNGAHMFALGVGNSINVANLPFISGPDQFVPPFGDIFTDDYSTGSFEELTANLSAGVNAICGTELSLDKTVDFDQVCGDETITFTLTVENSGGTGFDAVDVTITDTFSNDFQNLAIVGAPVPGAEIDGQTLTYNVGNLPAGASISIQIEANLPGANGVYLNTANADALNANAVQAEVSVEKTDVVTSLEEVIACESYEWNGNTYETSGIYTFEGTNENDCPTLETLDLTINQPTTGQETQTACGSFEWNGTTYDESGTYEFTFEGEDGQCDSTATLNLTINESPEFVEYITSCEGQYQNDAEEVFNSSGVYMRSYDIGQTCPLEYTLYLTLANTPQPGQTPQPCYPEGSTEQNGVVVNEGGNCVCQALDCPELEANIGDPCDDGNPSTTGSTVDENCECTGGEVVFEGCTNTGLSFGEASPDCNSIEDITGAWTNEDASITVVAGDDYIFSVSNSAYYVTIADENDNILAFGQGTASWTSTFSGTVLFYSHTGPDCPTTSGSPTEHTKTVERICDLSGFDCPDLAADIGDPCDDGNPLTEGTTVDAECECTGGTEIVFEGCTNGVVFGNRTPECSGPPAVQASAWTAEYVVVNVQENIEYTFSISNANYFATVSTNDSILDVLAFGQETTTWTATFNGSVRFYSHAGPGCPETTGVTTAHTRTIQAGACIFDCDDLEANIGDACVLEGFFDTTVDENCECVGTPFDCDANGEFSNIGDPCVIEGEGGSFSASVATEAVGFPTTFEANATYNFNVPSGFSGNYDLTISADGETFNGSWRNEFRVRVTSPDGTNVTEGAPGGTPTEWQPTTETQVGPFTGEVTLEGLSGIEGEWTVEVRLSFNEGATINAIVDLDFNFVPGGTDGIIGEDCECFVPCLSESGVLTSDGSRRVCVGTGSEVTFDNAVLTGAAGDNSLWVLTQGNLNVLATDANGPGFDFDTLTPGLLYRIRHISYANDVDINEVLANPKTTGGCWEYSNSIIVNVVALPEPGTITLLNESNEFCPGQGSASYAGVDVTGEDANSFRYVLADENGTVVAVRTNNVFNLNSQDPGTYTIYRASWGQGFNPTTNGNNVNDLSTCVSLSNGVEIVVNDCEAAAFISSDPNPTAGPSWVTFSVDEPQQVQVEVYDLAGRHIKTVFNQNAAGGQAYRMQFDGTSLPNGVYMYRMTTESQVIVDKFMIAR